MPIPFSCPECDKQLRVKDELAGKKIKCPGCAETIAVPDDEPPTNGKVKAVHKGSQETSAKKPVAKPSRARKDDDDGDEDTKSRIAANTRKVRRKSGAPSNPL